MEQKRKKGYIQTMNHFRLGASKRRWFAFNGKTADWEEGVKVNVDIEADSGLPPLNGCCIYIHGLLDQVKIDWTRMSVRNMVKKKK